MNRFFKDFPQLQLLATSGSLNGKEKTVALSPEAMQASAAAVNKHLSASSDDIWFQCLPKNHIGGLSIYARAQQSRSKIFEHLNKKWRVMDFYSALCSSQATLCSLVPTQVFDLVLNGLQAPSSLRAVVVGGAALSENLYLKARKLKWPLLPSFGMTESCSQIATATLDSLKNEECYPKLELLSHMEAKTDEENLLYLKSPALLSGYVYFNSNDGYEFINPVKEGWFKTEDKVELVGGNLCPLGRVNDLVKISGELVSRAKLEKIFDEVLLEKKITGLALHLTPDERRGYTLELHYEPAVEARTADDVFNCFNLLVKPFEKMMTKKQVSQIKSKLVSK